MKIYVLPLLLSASFSAPLFATDAQPPAPPVAPEAAATAPAAPAAAAPAPVAAQAATPQAPPVAPDNSFDSLQKARAVHMQAMHERMAKIWATQDINERQKLLEEQQQAAQEFRQKMQEMMQDMTPNWGAQAPGPGYAPGYGRGWGPGMPPGMAPGGMNGGEPGWRGPGKRHSESCPHRAEIEQRLDAIEATLKKLAEKP